MTIKQERFCCWCGKAETTETCQDPALKKICKEIAKSFIKKAGE